MDKIYEMLKSPDEDINTLGARLLVDLAHNNIFRFVNMVDGYEIRNRDKAFFIREKMFGDYSVQGFINYRYHYIANWIIFEGFETKPNNINLIDKRTGQKVI